MHNMNNWKCKICGFEAFSEDEWHEHKKHSTDKAHRELLKEKAKNKTRGIKEEAEDAWADVSKHLRRVL